MQVNQYIEQLKSLNNKLLDIKKHEVGIMLFG